MEFKPIKRKFFERNPDIVAKELLGKLLIREDLGLVGKIVETEAYFGPEDPASHASRNLKRAKIMWDKPGLAYVYNCHKYPLLNVVAHKNSVGAVLIRALEPLMGVDKMMENRNTKDIYSLTNGPGKLTQAFRIGLEWNGHDLTKKPLYIGEGENISEIGISKRIGVRDEKPLRFFIKKNPFVSKR